MARAHREAREGEPLQEPPDMALRNLDAKPFPDLGLKVDAAPAHHAVHRHVRPVLDQLFQRAKLGRRQPRRPPRPRPAAQTLDPFCVVADHPVPQRLAVHPHDPRCLGPRRPFHHQRDRQQPDRLVAILRPPSRQAQPLRRKFQPRDRQRHDDSP